MEGLGRGTGGRNEEKEGRTLSISRWKKKKEIQLSSPNENIYGGGLGVISFI